ncbi:hypothetical protein ACHAPX_000837 [Trichoderma viride]
MAGLPPNYNFTNQYDPLLQASISQVQQQQQQLQQPLFQHSQIQMQHIQHQQLQQQQQQTHQQQQTQLIQQLHQEARDRRERIRSKPFPTNVTQSVRDRQARGKDVYRSSEDEKTDEEDAHGEEARRRRGQHQARQPVLRKGNRNRLESVTDDESDDVIEGRDTDNEADILRRCRAEDFETRQRRAFAASVLDQPEQLMMYAQSGHDSIAGQRHRFMTIMCGYEDDEYWSNVGHHRATRRAARERQANMRKAMNIDRRTA